MVGTANLSRAQVFNVKSYGATGNGSTVDTAAINNAIKAASLAGGGTVTFPPGNYLSVSIHLSNNVTLYLSNSAVILGASSGYDAAESTPYSGYQDYGHSHFHDALIWGEKLHNIGIAGPGKIDGDGHLSTATTPSSGQGDKAVSLKLCTGVTITDVTITRGGHFGILANGCSNMVVSGAQILCSSDRDAFDLISSSDVEVSNCNIQGSDDSMCLKSDFALGEILTSSHINIHNCSILSTGNNATQFGSETEGAFYDINFSHIQIGSAGKAGIGITSNDGSIIDGVTYNDVTMVNCATPIFIKLSDQNRLPVSSPVGRIRNVSLNNIRATKSIQGGVEYSSVIHGKIGIPVSSVTLSNVYLTVHGGHPTSDASIIPPEEDDWRPRILGTLPAYGWYLRHVSGISFVNCKVDFDSNDGRPAVIVADGQNVKLDTFAAAKGSSSAYDLGFTNASTYQVTGSANTSGGALRILHSSDSSTRSIAAPPVFAPLSDSYSDPQTVTLSSPDAGATIRYTTDDSTPTATSGTVYSGPIAVSAFTGIRAISSASGLVDSAVNTAVYSFGSGGGGGGGGINFEAENLSWITNGATAAVQTDSNTSGGQWVLLSATGVGQYIEYTLPNVPAGTYDLSMAYKGLNSRGQLSLSVDGSTLGGVLDQYSASASYPSQTFGTVTFSSTGNHLVRLTVTGKNASSSSYGLSADVFVLNPSSSLPQVATPTFSPPGGAYGGAQSVSISTTTAGATIRYTTDGSTPSETHGTQYSGPVTVSATTTINAVAYESGMSDSAVAGATYTISAPDFTVSATPASQTVSPGSNTTYTVNIGNVNAFNGTVALGVSGLPAGATANFNPATVDSLGSSTLTVSTGASTPVGSYTLTITGTSGSLSHSATVTLVVSSGGTTVSFEAENVAVTSSGASTSVQTDSKSSNGEWIELAATGTGQWMEFTTPSIDAGTYQLSMMWKGNTTRGIAGFSVDGTSLGSTLDQYSSSQTYPTTVIGTLTFSSTGPHKVRLTVTGKNSASSAYQLSADKFTFTAQ